MPWVSRCLVALAVVAAPTHALAQDLSAIVARASEQMDAGNFADGMRTLSGLRGKTLPPQLAVEVALLETTGSLVTSTADAARDACGRAVVAAGYDPDVARERSPKVREVCKAAAKKVRADRMTEGKVEPTKLEVERPEVAHQAVRLSTKVEKIPAWLRMIARVQSSELEGTFDVPLVPSDDGALLGTLDSAWTRPRSKLTIKLVAQDRFGDIGEPIHTEELVIPAHEAAISLGSIPSGGRVEVDGERVTPDEAGRVPASAGKHEVKLTLPSGAYAETEVDLQRGTVAQVTLAPSEQGPSRVAPWIATGTSLALGVAGAVLLVNAELRRADLEEAAAEREPGTGLPLREYSELESIDSERRTFLYAGLGVLGGAGAVGVLATILWLVPSGGGDAAPTTAVFPVISPSFIGVAGSF
jgi:hypothetical protein